MRRGAWHQCGDRSQKLVEEQLQNGVGVGVILSPRDLAKHGAIGYAKTYHDLGAHVLIDQQFHKPTFNNRLLKTYPISEFRAEVSALNKLSDTKLVQFANELRTLHAELNADGVIAPAVMYEAGRADIQQLNARLFEVAKQVGTDLHIPTYATIVLARSVTASDQTVAPILAAATALKADGWYFAFEFDEERIPSSGESVLRCCEAGLTLACTGKPVLHAYAGPVGLLSYGFGATGVAVGHSQNLWKFTRDRWQEATPGGGNGAAPPRFFSSALWGTIIYPDEFTQLSASLKAAVLTPSPFSDPVGSNPPLKWSRWSANKHLVFMVMQQYQEMAKTTDPRANAKHAGAILDHATKIHGAIANEHISLADETNVYQANWRDAILKLLAKRESDFDYLELLN